MAVRSIGVGAPAGAARLDARVATVGGRHVLALDAVAAAVALVGVPATVLAVRAAPLSGRDLELQAELGNLGPVDLLLRSGTGTGPLARLGEAALARSAPLDPVAVLVIGAGVRVLLAAALWLVLRRALAPGIALLVPLAVVVAHPLVVVAGTSPGGVVGPLAASVAVLAAVAAQLRWDRRRRPADLAAVAAATAVGLGLHPLAAVIPLVLAGLVLAGPVLAGPVPAAPPGRALHREPALVAAGVVAAAAALAAAAGAPPRLPGLDAAGWGAAGRSLLAGVVGGPWRWSTGPGGRFTTTEPGAVPLAAAAVAATLLLLLVAVRARRRLLAVLPPTLVWVIAAVALGAPAGAVVALALGLALAGCAPREAPAVPVQQRAGGGGPAGTPADRVRAAVAGAARPLGLGLGGVLLTAWLVSAGLALGALGRAASAAPGGPWLAAVRASFADLPPFPRVLPRPVPAPVARGAAAPVLLDAPLVRLLRPDVLTHDADGPALTLDDAGRLGAAATDTVAATAPAGLCVANAQPGAREPAWAVPAGPAPPSPGALARLELLVTGTTRIEVLTRDAAGTVRPVRAWSADVLYQGPHTVVYPVATGTGVAAVGVRALTPDAGLCVVSAQVVVPR